MHALTRKVTVFLLLFVLMAKPLLANKQERIASAEKLLEQTQGPNKIKLLKELSQLYLDSLPERSISYANEIVELSGEDPLERANALYYVGNLYRNLHQYTPALENHRKALELRRKIDHQPSIAVSLNNIGEIHKIIHNYQEALKNFEASLKIRNELGNIKDIAYTLNNIGSVYWLDKDYGNALEYYLRSLELRSQIGDKSDISSSFNNLGNVYRNLKKYNKALNYYLKALDIRKTLGDKQLIAYTLNDIGGIYWRLNNYNEALNYFQQSLKLRRELGERRYIASTLKNIGIVYKDLNELDYSLKYYNEALQEYSDLRDFKEQANIYSYIANLYRSYNNLDKSLEYFNISLELHKKINNPQGIAYVSNNIGEILQEFKGEKKAEPYLLQAYEYANKTKDINLLKTTSENLFEYYSNKGNYKKALEYFRQFSETQYDSIVAERNNDKISEFEANYEITRTRDEINDLREFSRLQTILIFLFVSILILAGIIGYVTYKNIRIRKTATQTLSQKNLELEEINTRLKESEMVLRDLNITKDKFFNVISRDLKEPFKDLKQVSQHLYRDFELLSHEQKFRNSKTLYDLAIHTNTLVENLLLWAASQTGKTEFKPEFLNLKQLVDRNIQRLEEPIIEKNLKITYNLDDQITAYADEESISEVFRNLLTNAVKFSYPEGRINISLQEKKYLVEIQISDEGMGISEDNLNKIFRLDSDYLALGTAQEKGSGIGLLLCREYIEKNGGKIWAESEAGKGSQFFFTLPRNNKLSDNQQDLEEHSKHWNEENLERLKTH